jgi:hypothetical protein
MISAQIRVRFASVLKTLANTVICIRMIRSSARSTLNTSFLKFTAAVMKLKISLSSVLIAIFKKEQISPETNVITELFHPRRDACGDLFTGWDSI